RQLRSMIHTEHRQERAIATAVVEDPTCSEPLSQVQGGSKATAMRPCDKAVTAEALLRRVMAGLDAAALQPRHACANPDRFRRRAAAARRTSPSDVNATVRSHSRMT